MEYKPEQLATLLAAGHHTAVSTMSPVTSMQTANGVSTLMYRQVRKGKEAGLEGWARYRGHCIKGGYRVNLKKGSVAGGIYCSTL